MPSFNFSQNDRVSFELGGGVVLGRIVGCGTTEFPVMGRIWLVETDPGNGILPNEEYPFTVASIPECLLKRI